MTAKVAISVTDQLLKRKASVLAKRLNIPLLEHQLIAGSFEYIPNQDYDFLLVLTPDYLGIQSKKEHIIFHVDFCHPKISYRLHSKDQKELLAKAIRPYQTVLDATAGFGKDAFILASLGFKVIMLEKSPIVFYLLQDGLKRASLVPALKPILNNLALIHADAIHYLNQHPKEMEVIYLDPMFPERGKSAKSKKEMQLLQTLIGTDENQMKLVQTALTCAKHRVVVKRPRKGPAIMPIKPNFVLNGKRNRFDVYTSF